MGNMSAYGPAVLSEHLQHASYFYAPDGLDGALQIPIGPDDELSRKVTDILYDKSRRLAEVPHDENGLRTEKIATFFASQDLAVKTFIGVDDAGQSMINKITNGREGASPAIASHFPLLGLNYIRYNTGDSPGQRQAKEPSVVHELTHASQPHLGILICDDDRMYRGVGYSIVQNGFTVRSAGKAFGNYFEEGFASLEAHQYIVDELELPNGLLDRTEPLRIDLESDVSYFLPGSYLWEGDNPGYVSWSPSAHAAYGLQLLNSLNPAIVPAMLEARRSDRGLDKFAGQVDALLPGLHGQLNAQPYDGKRFMQATHDIVRRLLDGKYDDALAMSADQDGVWRQELIAA
jgi:hypothetical protein